VPYPVIFLMSRPRLKLATCSRYRFFTFLPAAKPWLTHTATAERVLKAAFRKLDSTFGRTRGLETDSIAIQHATGVMVAVPPIQTVAFFNVQLCPDDLTRADQKHTKNRPENRKGSPCGRYTSVCKAPL
jgi:hypothetical protein